VSDKPEIARCPALLEFGPPGTDTAWWDAASTKVIQNERTRSGWAFARCSGTRAMGTRAGGGGHRGDACGAL